MECMCAQTRARFILSSKSFGGMKSETTLAPKEKSPLPEAQRRVGAVYPFFRVCSYPIVVQVCCFLLLSRSVFLYCCLGLLFPHCGKGLSFPVVIQFCHFPIVVQVCCSILLSRSVVLYCCPGLLLPIVVHVYYSPIFVQVCCFAVIAHACCSLLVSRCVVTYCCPGLSSYYCCPGVLSSIVVQV